MQSVNTICRPHYVTRINLDEGTIRMGVTGFDRVALPRDVLPLDMLRALPRDDDPPLDGGVYFLWRGPHLVYVGQTYCLNERLHSHWRTQIGLRSGKRIPFTWRSWMVCEDDCREGTEAAYIRAYLPPYNSKIP